MLKSKSNAKGNRYTRSTRGSALAEFGPALGILLFMLFFPLIDCLSLGASYASCMVLNYCQLREAAFCSKQEAESAKGPVRSGIPKSWKQEGLGQFVNIAKPVETLVSYVSESSTASTGIQDQYVQVTTTVVANPFLTVPLFPGIPGLGAPMTFRLSTERLVESSRS